MVFGNNLRRLRLEKDLSQEALAVIVKTTTQEVIRWENNEGYPETEQLILLSETFDVSIDFLLKGMIEEDTEEGYYVEEEMAENYILNERKSSKYIGLGFSFIVLSFLPYNLFPEASMFLIPTIILISLALALFFIPGSWEDEQFQVLKRERLVFEETYLDELQNRYAVMKRRYNPTFTMGSILVLAGFLLIGIDKFFINPSLFTSYYPFLIIMIAIGIYMAIYSSSILETYRLLAANEEHFAKIEYKLKKKGEK